MKNVSINVKFFAEGGRITKIDLEASKNRTKWEVVTDQRDAALEKMINAWMDDYCRGCTSKVQLPLDLDTQPPYTKKILNALMNIPFGRTISYQELAIQTKNPLAARAVGNACGRNPFPLVIPCHRVLKNDGSLGGYAFGSPLKEALLKFENAL